MSYSGFVQVFTSGREKYYSLKPGVFDSLLFSNGNTPVWISWAPLFKGLELVWQKIVSIREGLDGLLVASELRRIIQKIENLFFKSRLDPP